VELHHISPPLHNTQGMIKFYPFPHTFPSSSSHLLEYRNSTYFAGFFLMVGTRSKNASACTSRTSIILRSILQILQNYVDHVLFHVLQGNTNTVLSLVHKECGIAIFSQVHQRETLPPSITQEIS
jgi:hypothetical protein